MSVFVRAIPWFTGRTKALLLTIAATVFLYLRARAASLFASVTVAGVVYFGAAIVIEQALRPTYNPVQTTISELAVGRYGFLLTSGFYALGTSFLTMGLALWRGLRATLTSRLGLALLAVCGIAAYLAGIFPTDLAGAVVTTTAGTIHMIVASAGYTGLILAIWLFTRYFHRDEAWRAHHRVSLALGVLGSAALIAVGFTGHTAEAGLAQRIMAVTLLAWVGLTALRLRALARPTGR
jgi:hypothetical membrane protein